jgi:predicted transcriptional regulator
MEIVLFDREVEVMEVLWSKGSATVAEVRDEIDELAYTTVLTVLRRLEDKGYVAHEEEGRAHRYFATIERSAARKSAVERLTQKLFESSPGLLLTHLVADRKLSKTELRRLKEMVEAELSEDE